MRSFKSQLLYLKTRKTVYREPSLEFFAHETLFTTADYLLDAAGQSINSKILNSKTEDLGFHLHRKADGR